MEKGQISQDKNVNFKGYIYIISNDINKKVYIGQTRVKNPYNRWSCHRCNAKKVSREEQVIAKAIRKYGESHFTFKIIESIEKDSLDELINILLLRESEYIEKYQSLSPKGYNLISRSFDKNIVSEETRKKISLNTLKYFRENPYVYDVNHWVKRIKNTGKFYRVRRDIDGNKFVATFRESNGKVRIRSYSNERDAAIAVDLYLIRNYGKCVELNINENREKYLSGYIKEPKPIDIRNITHFKFVKKPKNRDKFHTVIINKNRKQIFGGSFFTEKEAAHAADYLMIKHGYNKDELNFPQLYGKYIDNLVIINPIKKIKEQQLLDKGGNIVKFMSMAKFARENGLPHYQVVDLCKGEIKERGGFKSLKYKDRPVREWKILSPNNEVITFNCIADFAKKNNLNKCCVWDLLNGKQSIHHGWKRAA